MYQALYRKYRPQTFSDVVGQKSVTDTLRAQLETGKLSHAYLFTGVRGTGKTTCAKIFAKAVNCLHPQNGDPCGECARGIVCCTTGIGVSITANKVKGIRCALLDNPMSARLTREHNDTNMMALGAAVTGEMLALEIVDVWLDTAFSGVERHQRRIDKMMAYEHD